MSQYNHTAIEKKWRENWEKHPDQCQRRKESRNITAWICSHIRPEADCT